MSDGQAEDFAALIEQTLKAAPALAGVPVYRDRHEAFGADEPLAIVVELQDESSETMGHGPMRHTRDELVVLVLHLVRDSSWQTKAAQQRVASNRALMAQPALVQAHLRRGRAQWAAASAEVPVAQLGQEYLLTYISNATTLGPV